MAFKVEFNGVDLSAIVDGFTGITRNIGSGWTNFTNSGPFTGNDFLYNKKNSKTITVNFIVNVKDDRFVSVRNSLARALNVDKPAALKFEDDPNNVWYAVPDGTPTLDESSFYQANGSITFLVPDSVSHSVDTKTVTASVVDGILTANIDYQGSEETYPTIRIKHKDENGYIGIVHLCGVLELGNRKESDTENVSKATVILNTRDFSEFKPYTGNNSENPRKSNSGYNGLSVKNGDKFYGMADAGTNNGYWHGGSSVFNFPADGTGKVGSKNVYCYFNLVFWALKNGQTADFQILFMDKNDNLVMGYDIYKIDGTGNTAKWTALVGDGKGGIKTLKMQDFPTDHLDNHNPFNFPRGHSDIYKINDIIRFYWAGSNPVFKVPELKDVEITKCYVNFYQLENRSGDQLMGFFDLRNVIIRNDTAGYINDIPNRYAKDSEVVINSESDEICVNGLPANDDFIKGSEFPKLIPGKNKIEFYTSSWIKSIPEITVEYKERWL